MDKLKRILFIHTGGTIGSASREEDRTLDGETVKEAKRMLQENFEKSASEYAEADLLVDAGFPEEKTTLSESMYPEKLMEIARFLNERMTDEYAGVIVLHGTDTLAYTASVFSFMFANVKMPIILVSGNRPPDDRATNANVNFKTAIELICRGIAPNVYAVYRNSDLKVRLILGSTLMQCPNCSEDFRGASESCSFELINSTDAKNFEMLDGDMFGKCKKLSEKRRKCKDICISNISDIANDILLIHPYTGLNYLLYTDAIRAGKRWSGIVHGTYHSGTVCFPGLVKKAKALELAKKHEGDPESESFAEMLDCVFDDMNMEYEASLEMRGDHSIFCLALVCLLYKIPLFIAPSKLGKDQYDTMSALCKEMSSIVLLNMTSEAAYAKLVVGVSCGLKGKRLISYMKKNICNEMLD